MLEGKKAGLTLYVASTKLVGDVAVSVCFPANVDSCTLAKLNNGCNCGSDCFPSGSEEAAVCHALFLSVRQILCGDPLAVSKSKVGDCTSSAHNGQFYINWKVKGTVSAVRKSIGLAVKVLNPAKMYAIYQRCIRELGSTPKRESFAYVADQIKSSIKSSLTVGVVGNIKCDKDKLEGMLDVISKKHNVSAVDGSKSKPDNHVKCDHSSHTELKISGWSAAVLADYLTSKVRGLNVMQCNNSLLLPIKPNQWDALAKKLKSGVKEYVKTKYERVATDLPEVFGYLSLSSTSLCACDVKTMINNKLNTSSVESAILKGL